MDGLKIKLEEWDEQSLALSRFMVIEKIISKRILNRKGVMAIIRGMWPVEMVPWIFEVGINVYGVSFRSEECLGKVIKK